MTDYRVNLDIYNGPLDLLLYLIRREELDIHDIPIAKITQQYCQYVDTLKNVDPDLAGDFLVMAATLLEIKTRMLLPTSEAVDEEQEAFDPRSELVRQLLEYKAFKDAAGDLREQALRQSLRFPRRPPEIAGAAEQEIDLEEVQLWDLVEAFNKLLASVGQLDRQREIIYDDTPIELHVEDILDRLGREGNMTFRQIFAGRTRRTEIVGLFLALLELIRRRRIYVEQERVFGEIYIFLNPDPQHIPPPEEAAPVGPESAAGAQAGEPAPASAGPTETGEQLSPPTPAADAAPSAPTDAEPAPPPAEPDDELPAPPEELSEPGNPDELPDTGCGGPADES